jgi:hypothetical protein
MHPSFRISPLGAPPAAILQRERESVRGIFAHYGLQRAFAARDYLARPLPPLHPFRKLSEMPNVPLA